MRIAIISDIHGNLPALKAVLAKIDGIGVDFIACAGDIAGYGPWVNECIALVRDRCRYVVMGNHEFGLLQVNEDFEDDKVLQSFYNSEALAALRYTALRVSNGELEWIQNLPGLVVFDEVSLTMTHGGFIPPYFDDYILTLDDAMNQIKNINTTVGVVGNSHMVGVFIAGYAFADSGHYFFDVGERFVVNAGSVGQPRDGNSLSSFVVLNEVDGCYKVELHRVYYNVEETFEQIIKEGLPTRNATRLCNGS